MSEDKVELQFIIYCRQILPAWANLSHVCERNYETKTPNQPNEIDEFQTPFDSWSFFLFAKIPKKLEIKAKVNDEPE